MKMKRALKGRKRDEIRRRILAVLAGGESLYRREINHRLADAYGLTADERRDNAPDSRRNLLFSAIGTLLSDLTRDGTLTRSAEGRYTLVKETRVAVRDARCREEILAYLAGGEHTRSEIYTHLERHFGTDATETTADDHALRSMAGNLLERLMSEGEIAKSEGGYRRTPLPDVVFPPEDEERLRRAYLLLLHRQGGPFLERFAVTLLAAYFKRTGKQVLLAEVTGGAADGGIDGRIDTVDTLGFAETVLLQTKCRREDLHVAEREVRGFFGAVCAIGGSRGIFVTTSYFHEGAERFLASIPNCVGIDGKKLFAIAKECSFGLHRTREGYTIDKGFFSESI